MTQEELDSDQASIIGLIRKSAPWFFEHEKVIGSEYPLESYRMFFIDEGEIKEFKLKDNDRSKL